MVSSEEAVLDEVILQVFEEQEEVFHFPVTTQKDARAFVKALHRKGLTYDCLSQEIKELEQNFSAWRTGISRPGIGNRMIERINRPFQELLLSDGEDDVDCCDKLSTSSEERMEFIGIQQDCNIVSQKNGRDKLVSKLKSNEVQTESQKDDQHLTSNHDKNHVDVSETDCVAKNNVPDVLPSSSVVDKTAAVIEERKDLSKKQILTTEECKAEDDVKVLEGTKADSKVPESSVSPSVNEKCSETVDKKLQSTNENSAKEVDNQNKDEHPRTCEDLVKTEVQDVKPDAEKLHLKTESHQDIKAGPDPVDKLQKEDEIVRSSTEELHSVETKDHLITVETDELDSLEAEEQDFMIVSELPKELDIIRLQDEVTSVPCNSHQVLKNNELKDDTLKTEDSDAVNDEAEEKCQIGSDSCIKTSDQDSSKMKHEDDTTEEILKHEEEYDSKTEATALLNSEKPLFSSEVLASTEIAEELTSVPVERNEKLATELNNCSSFEKTSEISSQGACSSLIDLSNEVVSSCAESNTTVIVEEALKENPSTFSGSLLHSVRSEDTTCPSKPKSIVPDGDVTRSWASELTDVTCSVGNKQHNNVLECYNSDTDEELNNDCSKMQKESHTHSQSESTEEMQKDGPGYVYVFTDSSSEDAQLRLKIGASRFPHKKLQQSQHFNIDMKLVSAVNVSSRQKALNAVLERLEEFSIPNTAGWFSGPLDNILHILMAAAKDYPVED